VFVEQSHQRHDGEIDVRVDVVRERENEREMKRAKEHVCVAKSHRRHAVARHACVFVCISVCV